jgi:hypothetical protein
MRDVARAFCDIAKIPCDTPRQATSKPTSYLYDSTWDENSEDILEIDLVNFNVDVNAVFTS